MSDRRSVVWSEGVLLSPQHLQQADRAWRHHVAERFRYAFPFDWGLAGVELDREAIRNGRAALVSVRGVLPDGTHFALPDEDALPASRAIEKHFDARQDTLTVYLGLASPSVARPTRGDAVTEGAAGPRYASEAIELNDETTAQNPQPVDLQRRHFQLLFPDDAVAEHDAVPIGQIERSGTGYAWRESYIPPVIALSGSELLQRKLADLRERVLEHYRVLRGQMSIRGSSATFAAQDATLAIRLHLFAGLLPVLTHIGQRVELHPHAIYWELSRFAGQLCAFRSTPDPVSVPEYEHRRLPELFPQLLDFIHGLIPVGDGIGPVIWVQLEQGGAGVWQGRLVNEQALVSGAMLVLCVRADLEEARYLTEVPRRLKVASQDRINELIARGLAGLPLTHLHPPPARVPLKQGFHYYRIEPQGILWEGIVRARDVAVFVPGEIPNVSLELCSVQG